jgi:hypothetical protein
MSATIDSFRLEILDSETGAILKHNIIGNRTYVSAVEGKEFAVRVTVYNPANYIDTLSGDDILSCNFYFNGKKGGGKHIQYPKSSAVASLTKKSISTSHGDQALVFNAPVVIPFFDVDDAKENIAINKDSLIGTISVKISSARKLNKNKSSDRKIRADDVHDTKKFFQRPNTAISAGRILTQSLRNTITAKENVLVAELKVWCQPDGIVSLFERLEREKDNDDAQQPVDSNVDSNDNIVQPCKIEKRVIAGTSQLVDLTGGFSSSHSSKKRGREDDSSSSSSSGSNGRDSFPIDLTAESLIVPVVKKELSRLSKGAVHIDLTS